MLQYFVPSLGPAPKWCYHLENIVEELDEVEAPAIYDDYKFVTKEQLEDVGLAHLIGTDLLRAHMHGYFMDLRLYNRARTLTQPQALQSHRRRKLREDMEKQSTAIPAPKDINAPKVKVNKQLAIQLQASVTETKDKKQKERAKIATELLTDNRFASLFENLDFNIDEESEQFKQMAKRGNIRKAVDKNDDDTTDEEEGPKSGLFIEDEHVSERDDDNESTEDDEDTDESTEDDEEEDEGQQDEAIVSEDEGEVPEAIVVKKPSSFRFVAVDSRRQLNTLRTGEKEVDQGADETFGARRKVIAKNSAGTVEMDDTPFGTKSITYVVKDDEKSQREAKAKKHLEERRAVHRSAGSFGKPLPYSLRGRGGRQRR